MNALLSVEVHTCHEFRCALGWRYNDDCQLEPCFASRERTGERRARRYFLDCLTNATSYDLLWHNILILLNDGIDLPARAEVEAMGKLPVGEDWAYVTHTYTTQHREFSFLISC